MFDVVTNIEILSKLAKRTVSPVISEGVIKQDVHPMAIMKMHEMAVKRWMKNNRDKRTLFHPQGINVEVTNGKELIETMVLSDFPGLVSPLHVLVFDHGIDSKIGLAVLIVGPDEY